MANRDRCRSHGARDRRRQRRLPGAELHRLSARRHPVTLESRVRMTSLPKQRPGDDPTLGRLTPEVVAQLTELHARSTIMKGQGQVTGARREASRKLWDLVNQHYTDGVSSRELARVLGVQTQTITAQLRSHGFLGGPSPSQRRVRKRSRPASTRTPQPATCRRRRACPTREPARGSGESTGSRRTRRPEASRTRRTRRRPPAQLFAPVSPGRSRSEHDPSLAEGRTSPAWFRPCPSVGLSPRLPRSAEPWKATRSSCGQLRSDGDQAGHAEIGQVIDGGTDRR